MKVEHIPLDHTGQFPRLITDYISLEQDMKVFVDYEPSMIGLKERIRDCKQLNKDNAVLTSVLQEQHGDSLTDSQRVNLDALRSDQAFTVCTGHQLCLFGGPVYMMYKIAATISLSDKLSKETGEKVVPLFWMASEDHDVEEVSSMSLFGRKVAIDSDHVGAVGDLILGGMANVLSDLKAILGENANAEVAFDFLSSAYKDGLTMVSAFRDLIQRLFSDFGLLILDASDRRLKDSFKQEIKTEVFEELTHSSIQESLNMLVSRGESVQATPRAINLFYMHSHTRKRIVREGDKVAVLEGPSWTVEEFKEELNEFPERFSPNVLFRPVYQEFLLPNIAYIGGPGELSYWLQLKGVFKAYGMDMPALILRDSFMWVDDKTAARWNDLGFDLIDLFRGEDALFKEFAQKNAEEETDLSGDKEVMVRQFDKLIEKSRAIDPGILGFANSERTKLLKSIENLEKKLVRAEKKKHTDSLSRISSIKSKFLPGGNLRERQENFLHWYLRYGDEFFKDLVQISDPLDGRVKVVKV